MPRHEYDAAMARWCSLLVATSLVAACRPAAAPVAPPSPDDVALRIRVASAEARRAGGVAELAGLAARSAKPARMLALRGLGRIGATGATGAIGATGGTDLASTLLAALGDRDPDIVGAAAQAIGLAGSLDDGDLGATDALLAALPRGGAAVVEALGRAGTQAAQPALTQALGDPALAAQAALALGRFGRRKLALAEPSRRALVTAAASADPQVRYAAVYALAREFEPPADPDAIAALIARIGDPVAEIRALAIAGLGRRKAIAAARAAGAPLDQALLDRDWRVAVEAVRVLADSDDGKDAIAAAAVRRYGALERGDATAAHIVLEAERALAGAARRPAVAQALAILAAHDPASAALPALTRGWIECLAAAATVRAQPAPELAAVERCGLADHLRLPLVAELVAADVGSLAVRRAALAKLLGHREPRVRAAGLGAIAALWKTGEPSDQRGLAQALTAALEATDPAVAGAAVDAATAVSEAIGAGDHGWLDAAVVARATRERDPELGASLFELIGKRAIAAGAAACRAGLTGDPVRAKAAAHCLAALGEPAAAAAPVAATALPVDVTAVIGRRLRWHVTTSRGEVVIRLRPEAAPWAVAAVVALTRKGFYDGLEFHRVVPDFVVQGGDPTESGAGGPGFALPAEPAALGDGAGYVEGGVGIADAGRDSGGSQWFLMHSRAPHLDGRYTWFGAIEAGQDAANALLVGDRILHATIEVLP